MPGYKIAEFRKRAGLTQSQLAERLGTTQQTVQYYESGRSDIKSSTLVSISEVLGVSVTQLLGLDREFEVVQCPRTVSSRVPYLGYIPAGTQLEAIEMTDEYAWCDPDIAARHPHGFLLGVHGDSMNLKYRDGSMVLIDPDDREIVSGKIYAVLVNGCDATLKQVFIAGDTIVLHPMSTNKEHRDRSIDKSDPDAIFFAVIGRVVWYVGSEE